MASYLAQTTEQREAAARLAKADELIERLKHFEDGIEIRDDRPSLEILREIRATDDSAPMRDVRRKTER
jgi:hypothetical protein